MKGVTYTSPVRSKPWRVRIIRKGRVIIHQHFRTEARAIAEATKALSTVAEYDYKNEL